MEAEKLEKYVVYAPVFFMSTLGWLSIPVAISIYILNDGPDFNLKYNMLASFAVSLCMPVGWFGFAVTYFMSRKVHPVFQWTGWFVCFVYFFVCLALMMAAGGRWSQ